MVLNQGANFAFEMMLNILSICMPFCRHFTETEIQKIKSIRFADILRNATKIDHLSLQDSVFTYTSGKMIKTVLKFMQHKNPKQRAIIIIKKNPVAVVFLPAKATKNRHIFVWLFWFCT